MRIAQTNKKKLRTLLSAVVFVQILVTFSPVAVAQVEAAEDPFFLAMSLENDSFVPSNSDNDYTMGLEINYAGPLADEYFLRLLDAPLRKGINKLVPDYERQSPSLALGSTAYTPNDIEAESLVLTNRPYASLIYFEHRNVYIKRSGSKAIKTGSLFGLMGTPVAETVQTEIHKLMDGDIPQGWKNEVGRGGIPMLMYSASRSDELWSLPLDLGCDTIQAWSDVGGSLGYRTGVSARLNVALGWIRRPFHSHGAAGAGPAQVLGFGGNYIADGVWEPGGDFGEWLLPNEFFLTASASTGYLLHDSSVSGYPWDSKFDHFEDHRDPVRDSWSVGLTSRWGGFTCGARFKSEKNELDFSDDRHEYGLIFMQFQKDP